jgi:hypothetical protein
LIILEWSYSSNVVRSWDALIILHCICIIRYDLCISDTEGHLARSRGREVQGFRNCSPRVSHLRNHLWSHHRHVSYE